MISNTSVELCVICRRHLRPDYSDVTSLATCKHLYHTSCFVRYARNGYATCKKCLDEKPGLMDVLSDAEFQMTLCKPSETFAMIHSSKHSNSSTTRDASIFVEAYPLDWGDDSRNHAMLIRRLAVYRRIRTVPISSSQNPNMLTQEHQVGVVGTSDPISSFFTNAVKQKRLLGNNGGNAFAAPPNTNYPNNLAFSDQNNTIFASDWEQYNYANDLDRSVDRSRHTIKSKLDDLTRDIAAFNLDNAELWQKAGSEPLMMMNNRVKLEDIYRKFHINAKYLIEKNIPIEFLFKHGYKMDDLIYLLGATWNDLRAMMLSPTIWAQYKSQINLSTLVNFLIVGIDNIFLDICQEQFDALVQIQFTADELKSLAGNLVNETVASWLIEHGLTKEYMILMNHISMSDWKTKLDLQEDEMIDLLRIYPPDLLGPKPPTYQNNNNNNAQISATNNLTTVQKGFRAIQNSITTTTTMQNQNAQQQQFLLSVNSRPNVVTVGGVTFLMEGRTLGWIPQNALVDSKLQEFDQLFPKYRKILKINNLKDMLDESRWTSKP